MNLFNRHQQQSIPAEVLPPVTPAEALSEDQGWNALREAAPRAGAARPGPQQQTTLPTQSPSTPTPAPKKKEPDPQPTTAIAPPAAVDLDAPAELRIPVTPHQLGHLLGLLGGGSAQLILSLIGWNSLMLAPLVIAWIVAMPIAVVADGANPKRARWLYQVAISLLSTQIFVTCLAIGYHNFRANLPEAPTVERVQ